jgi:hypothetical protein
MKRKKEIEHVCGNCRLFDGPSSTCSVRLLVMGQTFRDVPVDPKDKCLWEELGVADHIKQARFRCIDPMTGRGTDGNGMVVIEYEDDFFGKEPG